MQATPRTPAKFVHKVEEDLDLMEALTVGLTKSAYDCMVCWDVVRPAHKVWSCQICWAVFHLDCLSTWAKKSSEDSNNHGAGWRCPGCQNTQISIPSDYTCFCGKVHEPDFNRYFTPHSCGELCGRSRDCPHPCNIPCHPGPCPPCGGLGPTQSCHCGSESFQLRCVDTDFTFQSGKSCNRVCGELLGCGKHSCSSVCHPGLCSPCEEEQVQKCYCGKHERMARCGDGIPKATLINGEEQTGYYECKDICKRPLACGYHECSKSCHILDDEPGQCPARPEIVKTCPCGANTIEALLMDASFDELSCSCGRTVLYPPIACGTSIPKCKYSCTRERTCAENSWDGKPRIIKCNDFCLIAERNKRVALALDIDDSTIRGPRIPHFDNYVLDYASANMEFTLKIEKRLAEWVSDSTLQTLNLQPMKGHHRKFVHELASHYNVTSESVDVEPYRSVVIHKKLNTSVPDVLASQACRQRRPNTSTIGTSGGGSGIEQLRKSNIKDPINAIYLHDLANGLTRAELSVQLAPIFGNIKYGIRWLTDDDAVLVPHPGNMTVDEFEVLLVRLRTGIKSLVTNGQLCERVELCWMNKEGEVVGHTNVGQAKRFFNAAQGNQLMKKPAPPKVENAFSILDDDERVAAAKKVEEEIVMKAKEAAGTLSLEAWGEDANNSFSSFTQKTSRPPSAIDAYHSEDSFSSLKSKMTRKADQNVVDDWQELLDDDVDDDQY
ncbi:FKBP12-associated protein [Mortierella sp. AD010]|nr:FKBP12-associated protein [Mortierella sp. AD010]